MTKSIGKECSPKDTMAKTLNSLCDPKAPATTVATQTIIPLTSEAELLSKEKEEAVEDSSETTESVNKQCTTMINTLNPLCDPKPPGTTAATQTIIPLTPEAEMLSKEKEDAVVKIFREALHLYKADEIMLSFNGGKDCTVLLHMLAKYFARNGPLQHLHIPVLYIQNEDAFEEIEEFVKECEQNYKIELIARKGSIKQILTEVCTENPKIKAVFMGSRRTDPYCENLTVMQATDPGWPPLMRINPIIDWSYRDIWNYIFANNVQYCSLYDRGYTSIGNKINTKPNPNLKIVDQVTYTVSYQPAYELKDDALERAGRV